MAFNLHVGINYSGAGTPTSRSAQLQVYAAVGGRGPAPITTPAATEGQHWNWTRREIAERLIGLAKTGQRFVAGIEPHPAERPADLAQDRRIFGQQVRAA